MHVTSLTVMVYIFLTHSYVLSMFINTIVIQIQLILHAHFTLFLKGVNKVKCQELKSNYIRALKSLTDLIVFSHFLSEIDDW